MFKKKYDDNNKKQSDDIELVLLKTVNNEYELNLAKNLLDEHEIVYIIRDYGVGGHMRIISGSSLYKTDILVEKSTFEKANAILDEFPWNE